MKPTVGECCSIAISAVAALTSVAVLLIVAIQIDRARLTLLEDGVLEFEFVQQTDHDLDRLSQAALALSRADPPMRDALAEALLLRYDELYPLSIPSLRWAGTLMQLDGADALMVRIRRFILAIEPEMSRTALPDAAELMRIARDAGELSKEVFEVGVQVLQRKTMLRNTIAQRLDRLVMLFWSFGALFLIAGLTLYLLMARAMRSADRMASEAESSRLQLESALDELTSGDIARKARNRFLAAATHDLRQPLQAMQYYLAALRTHVPLAPGRKILQQIERATDAAQAMLTSLLDLSRLDAGALEPQPRPLNVDALLARLREEFAVEASERSLSLTCEGEAGWVHTDPHLLERILRNLLANALACTERGGVSLRAEVNAAVLTIMVSDTGIGIAQRELETIFNEYYQAENGRRNGAGLGLGLSIVRRLTRLLDIEVRIVSRPGRGTRFELDLPTIQAPAPVRIVTEDDERASAPRGRLAIMLIDDEQPVRDGLATLLRQNGCQAICASSAEQARVRLGNSERMPDLIIADYQLLEGRTGLEAIDVVREELNEEVPAIIVTGDTAADRRSATCSLGIPWLHKPVAADELFRCIDELLGKQRLRALGRAGHTAPEHRL